MAKSRNSVAGPEPVKSTSTGLHTRGIHRKKTREYSLDLLETYHKPFRTYERPIEELI